MGAGVGTAAMSSRTVTSAESLGLTGEETFDITGVEAMNEVDAANGLRQGRRQGVRAAAAHRHPG